MNEDTIEKLVKKISSQFNEAPQVSDSKVILQRSDYPLAVNKRSLLKSATGKSLEDITLEAVMKDEIDEKDVRISAEVLEYQAQIAEACGKNQFAVNLRRAAEMTRIPDEKVLEIYELMRPNRATKEQLLTLAQMLESTYQATITANLVLEAADIYEKRGILK